MELMIAPPYTQQHQCQMSAIPQEISNNLVGLFGGTILLGRRMAIVLNQNTANIIRVVSSVVPLIIEVVN